jgi:hypothetical protein
MAKLALVYGMRLLPAEELKSVGSGTLTLQNGRETHFPLHILEGSQEEIEKQLRNSIEAFFEFFPER